jgi:hypothetical protein
MQISNSQPEFIAAHHRAECCRGFAQGSKASELGQCYMLVKSEEYRTKAFECAELAAKTKDPASKRILEETAQHWTELADGLERYEARLRPR